MELFDALRGPSGSGGSLTVMAAATPFWQWAFDAASSRASETNDSDADAAGAADTEQSVALWATGLPTENHAVLLAGSLGEGETVGHFALQTMDSAASSAAEAGPMGSGAPEVEKELFATVADGVASGILWLGFWSAMVVLVLLVIGGVYLRFGPTPRTFKYGDSITSNVRVTLTRAQRAAIRAKRRAKRLAWAKRNGGLKRDVLSRVDQGNGRYLAGRTRELQLWTVRGGDGSEYDEDRNSIASSRGSVAEEAL